MLNLKFHFTTYFLIFFLLFNESIILLVIKLFFFSLIISKKKHYILIIIIVTIANAKNWNFIDINVANNIERDFMNAIKNFILTIHFLNLKSNNFSKFNFFNYY